MKYLFLNHIPQNHKVRWLNIDDLPKETFFGKSSLFLNGMYCKNWEKYLKYIEEYEGDIYLTCYEETVPMTIISRFSIVEKKKPVFPLQPSILEVYLNRVRSDNLKNRIKNLYIQK